MVDDKVKMQSAPPGLRPDGDATFGLGPIHENNTFQILLNLCFPFRVGSSGT